MKEKRGRDYEISKRLYEKGYFEGDYIPYSLEEDGKILSNVSVNLMHFVQNGEM